MKTTSTRRSRRHRNSHSGESEQQPFFSPAPAQAKAEQPFFQPKLAIGQPGDKYEQEADAVADQVVGGRGQVPAVQKQSISAIQRTTLATPQEDEKLGTAEARMEKDKLVQEKPEVQRAAAPEEEEPVQMQAAEEEEPVQMQSMEEEEPVQMKAEEEEEPVQMQAEEEEEPVQMQAEEEEPVQMQAEEEEEPVQMQAEEEEEPVQMQAEEEEEPVQMKEEEEEPVQMKEEEEEPVQMMEGEEEEVQMQQEKPVQMKTEVGNTTAGPRLSNRIQNKAGNGKPLPGQTRTEMEHAFGTDFSGVNIHTDTEAVQMNKELGAQAFTHGKDVYFNSGKYRPESTDGKRLLAHELTHVVQQGGGRKSNIQRKKDSAPSFNDCTDSQKNTVQGVYNAAISYVNNAVAMLESAKSDHPNINDDTKSALEKHFHTTKKKHIKKIIKKFNKIKKNFSKGIRFECETDCDKNTLGYVWKFLFWHVGKVHICFDTFSKSSEGVKISTIIHEVAHRHAGVGDKAYNYQVEYSKLPAKKAMNNADSYSCFACQINGVSNC